jgi:hypothetical protein
VLYFDKENREGRKDRIENGLNNNILNEFTIGDEITCTINMSKSKGNSNKLNKILR